MDNQSDVRDLDQGLFHLPRPTLRNAIGYAIAAILFIAGFVMYSNGLSIPDIPQISEADRLDELGEIESYNFQALQDGYVQSQYQQNTAAFVLIPLELEGGIIATEECYESEDEDGNIDLNYRISLDSQSTLTFTDHKGGTITTSFDNPRL